MNAIHQNPAQPPRRRSVQLILRLEGAALFAISLLLFFRLDVPAWLFPVFLLAPDAGMIGYLAGPRIGATAYNICHTLALPAMLGAVGLVLQLPPLLAASLIWSAHIGMDHAAGFGLKYADRFNHTHLQEV